MTLDDLIELLVEVRRRYPASGSATLYAPVEIAPSYEHGYVLLGEPRAREDKWVGDDDEDTPGTVQ